MNCVIDNPMCDGTSCANCKLEIAKKERDEARELARRMNANAVGWLCGEEFDVELNSIEWLKEKQ